MNNKNDQLAQLIYNHTTNELAELVAKFSHTVNNPLNIIYAIVEDLEDSSSQPEMKEDFEKIKTLIKRLSSEVSIFKSLFQKTQTPPYAPIDLAKLIEDTLHIFYIPSVQSLRILYDKNEFEGVSVFGDQRQLTYILKQVLKNAREAMTETETRWISFKLRKQEQTVELLIIDNGKGVPENIRPLLFKENITSKPQDTHTGFSLCLCAQMAKSHGGELRFHPEAKETTFGLTLPAEFLAPKI